jgi:hypothetical protein
MQHTRNPARITASAKRFHALKLQGKSPVENWPTMTDAWIAVEHADPPPPAPSYLRLQQPSPPPDPPASPAEIQKAVAKFRDALRPQPQQTPQSRPVGTGQNQQNTLHFPRHSAIIEAL